MTKYKTRYDPPNIHEALDAAAGLTSDEAEQAEIAATLLGVSLDEATAAQAERAKTPPSKGRFAIDPDRMPASPNAGPSKVGHGPSDRVAKGPTRSPAKSYADAPTYDTTTVDPQASETSDATAERPAHPLDNRGSDQRPATQSRRNWASAPEVVVVRKTRPRASVGSGSETQRPAGTRKSTSSGGKLRLNLSN